MSLLSRFTRIISQGSDDMSLTNVEGQGNIIVSTPQEGDVGYDPELGDVFIEDGVNRSQVESLEEQGLYPQQVIEEVVFDTNSRDNEGLIDVDNVDGNNLGRDSAVQGLENENSRSRLNTPDDNVTHEAAHSARTGSNLLNQGQRATGIYMQTTRGMTVVGGQGERGTNAQTSRSNAPRVTHTSRGLGVGSSFAANNQSNQRNAQTDHDANNGYGQRYQGSNQRREVGHDRQYVNRKMMVPEKFDGRSDWDEYLEHFTAIASWNQWSEGEKLIQLGLCMTGRGRTVFLGLSLATRSKYESLISSLTRLFGPMGKEAAYKAEFRQRKRKCEESLMDYADDLNKLCKKAFPLMARSAREEVVMEQFKLGVDIELRKHVQFAHVTSLEEAVTVGLEYEAMDEGRKLRKPVVNVVQADSAESSGVDVLAKALEKITLLTEQNTKLLADLTNRKSQPRKCYHCSQEGHFKRNCPQLKSLNE